jgi:hypothetical protein
MIPHPYRTAWETRDLGGWLAALSEDVVLNSPLLRSPFVGRAAAAELFAVLFSRLERVEITHESAADDVHVFAWRAEARGRPVEGADFIRRGADGLIEEITVFIRPLVALGDFGAAVGPALARERGRGRAALSLLLSPALRLVLALSDAAASRLTQRRASR